MNIEKFTKLRPHLYHLTDEQNIDAILESRILKSTAVLVNELKMENSEEFLRKRRRGHTTINYKNQTVVIRDQDPLFENILKKNLEGNWTVEDFIYSLNERVFFWPTEKDLRVHYGRYENQNESPVILRFDTAELFAANETQPKFCRLNSGAPRCSCYYDEGAPPRGASTFLVAEEYETSLSSVREVTFEKQCFLPENIYISTHPNNPFKLID